MKDLKVHILLATAALAPALAVIIAWLAGEWFDAKALLMRLSLFSIALVIAGVCASIIMARAARTQIAAWQQLDLLIRTSDAELNSAVPASTTVDGGKPTPWNDLFGRLRDRMARLLEQSQAAEMSRAALEVRVRHHSAEHTQIVAILDSLSEPILAVNEYGELALSNMAAEKLFQLNRDERKDLDVSELGRLEHVLDLLHEMRRRKVESQRTQEIKLETEPGQERWYRVLVRSIPGTGGDADSRGALAVFHDVTSHKDIQKRNAEFVSAVSHEMKTPLAGIKAYVELLAEGDAEDEATREEFLGVINSQADRLQRLIDNLLNLARIEAGVVNVSKQSQSLNDLLEEALHIVRPAAENRRITLTNDLSPMYLSVLVDRDMLLQAAINLLSNAIKYTPEGGSITLRSRMEENRVQFEVEDSGVGLSEEDQSRVFEKFYRVKKDKNMASGTGLGLPLAKHIVEDVHGGQLTVKSILGKGSTFSISLPHAGQLTAAAHAH